jgi:hypothetical protein
VRIRAYEIWEREGRCGDPAAHWRCAEQELAGRAAGAQGMAPADMTGNTLPPDWLAALDSAVTGFMRGVVSHRPRRRAAALQSPRPSASRRNKSAA